MTIILQEFGFKHTTVQVEIVANSRENIPRMEEMSNSVITYSPTFWGLGTMVKRHLRPPKSIQEI